MPLINRINSAKQLAAALPVGLLRAGFATDGPTPPATLWRSVLGPALRAAVCVTGQQHCTACLLRTRCAYPMFYEPDTPACPPPFGVSPTPPMPYALHAYKVRDLAMLELRLFGSAALRQVPLLVETLDAAGRRGLGRERVPYSLQSVEAFSNEGLWKTLEHNASSWGVPSAPPPPRKVRVRLLSALRVQDEGRLVNRENFSAGHFSKALLRRIQLLAWAHGEAPAPDAPLRQLDKLELSEIRLSREGGQRYSARQKRAVPLDGLRGQFDLGGPALETLWDWLWLGQWTQVGKGATQGLGVYRLETAT